MKSELVKPTHLARRAVVYVRQSRPHQVVNNQESLRLQYALRQRAIELGWHESDIEVIDADLGISAASAAQRSGFKELIGRVGLKEIGLIKTAGAATVGRCGTGLTERRCGSRRQSAKCSYGRETMCA